MADRRPPGFNVDIGFYDSAEVLSIPRRIRAAAIGVWTLAGSYSANKLTDGLVTAEKLKDFGCTDAIRDALMSTTPEPLWERGAYVGSIQFTRWAKWQRTCAEVKAYKHADAERKKRSRDALHKARTSTNTEASVVCPGGQQPDVHPDDRNPRGRGRPRQTETKTKELNSSYLSSSVDSRRADADLEPIAATSGASIVRAVIPTEHPAAVQTALRIRASELINTGTPTTVVEAALRLWLAKPSLGPNALPALVSEVIKTQTGSTARAPATRKVGAGLALAAHFAENPNPQLEP